MRIRDLGPIWVDTAGVVRPLGGRRLEAVLSALLVRPGEVITTDWLIDAVWDEAAPPRAAAALDTLMWRLRRALEPERAARSPSAVLRTEDHGYRLTLSTLDVDSWAFGAFADGLPDEGYSLADAIDRTEAALRMWRGRPYASVADTGWLEPARSRLDEQRLTVQRHRIDALLAAGQPERAVAELIPILAENPYAEPLWIQRILGLRMAGRSAAALDAYRECQSVLDRELGTTPGPELRELWNRISRPIRETGEPTGAPGPGVFRVPRRWTELIGRAADLATVCELLTARRHVSIVGPVGCGKTRLAIAVAAAVRSEYPDGAYFVDLSDVVEPVAAADRVQETLALLDEHLVGPERVVTDFIADRSVLLVLDNCEQIAVATANLVDSLLSATSALGVIVTSRQPIGRDGEAVHLLQPLGLPSGSGVAELSESPAAQLFSDRLQRHAGVDDLTERERIAIVQICSATDGLPLGLELASALGAVLELPEIAAALTTDPVALHRPGGSLRQTRAEATLLDSIEWSHSLLGTDEQLTHRRLSSLPPGFTLDAAVAVCADPVLTAEAVPHALAGLTFRSLLQASGSERPDGPSLFRQLVPIRSHARGKLQLAGELADVGDRRDQWMRRTLLSGPRLGRPGQAAHYQHLDDNQYSITAALESRIVDGPTEEDLLAMSRLLPYWIDRTVAPGPLRLAAAADRAVGAVSSPLARGLAVAVLSSLHAFDQRIAGVRGELRETAVSLAPDLTQDQSPNTRLLIGDLLMVVASCCWVADDYALANAVLDIATAYGELLGDADLHVMTTSLRWSLKLVQDPAAAVAGINAMSVENQLVGNDFATLIASVTLSIGALIDGNGTAGLEWTSESLRANKRLGVRNVADTLETRGSHYANVGRPIEAVRCFAAAELQQTRLGRSWPRHPGTTERIERLRPSLSNNDFGQAWAAGRRIGADYLVEGWL